MERQMMRGVLERLERTGELTRCAVRVDPRFELGAVLSYYNSERPILFTNVAGSSVPVAGGLYGNRRILCDLLHTTPEGRIEKLIDAIAHPRDPVVLDRGPIQENAVTRGIDIRRMFPVPTSNEKDSAPFLTAGMLICRDTVTGQIHMAVRRFQVNEGNSINVLVSPASPHMLGIQ